MTRSLSTSLGVASDRSRCPGSKPRESRFHSWPDQRSDACSASPSI